MRVRGYSYKRRGKTIRVQGHSRSSTRRRGGRKKR